MGASVLEAARAVAVVVGAAVGASATYVKLTQRKIRGRTVALVHPVAKDGGGGERVLWCAIRAMMDHDPGLNVVLFTDLPGGCEGEDLSELMAGRARERFGVDLPRVLEVVPITRAHYVDPKRWPRFTLLFQSLASIAVGYEALSKLVPAVYVDTAGFTFTLPLARFFGCATAAYVHYPIISTDMLRRVEQRQEAHNNSPRVARSRFRSALKSLYYRAFALLYGAAGGCAQVAMVNSSWTHNHVQSLWWGWGVRRSCPGPFRVFPPCNTEDLLELPLSRNVRRPVVMSVGQFRPEKAHAVQLRAFALALKQAGNGGIRNVQQARLVLVGGCRNEEDESRVEGLKGLANELGIGSQVDFCVNVDYAELRSHLSRAVVGLHTMTDEHFGIGVVEYMAAGVVAVAHKSGGPAADIVVPARGADGKPQATGYLACTVEEYAEAIVNALTISDRERAKMQAAARSSVGRFSEAAFDQSFVNAMERILT